MTLNKPTSRVLMLTICMSASIASAESSKNKAAASDKEEAYMLGRIAAATEDLGGGYSKAAKREYEGVMRDIEKRQYSKRLRWLAYDGYGETLIVTKEKEKALKALNRAADEAKDLTDKERAETQQHVDQAQAMK